jgi:hypothetical protein
MTNATVSDMNVSLARICLVVGREIEVCSPVRLPCRLRRASLQGAMHLGRRNLKSRDPSMVHTLHAVETPHVPPIPTDGPFARALAFVNSAIMVVSSVALVIASILPGRDTVRWADDFCRHRIMYSPGIATSLADAVLGR